MAFVESKAVINPTASVLSQTLLWMWTKTDSRWPCHHIRVFGPSIHGCDWGNMVNLCSKCGRLARQGMRASMALEEYMATGFVSAVSTST